MGIKTFTAIGLSTQICTKIDDPEGEPGPREFVSDDLGPGALRTTEWLASPRRGENAAFMKEERSDSLSGR